MKKSALFVIAATTALLSMFVVMMFFSHSVWQDDMCAGLSLIENALGDEWRKQTVTEVSSLEYSDNNGNTIVYYLCWTITPEVSCIIRI